MADNTPMDLKTLGHGAAGAGEGYVLTLDGDGKPTWSPQAGGGGGGSQPLADVLVAGSDADGNSITNLAQLEVAAVNAPAGTGLTLTTPGEASPQNVNIVAGAAAGDGSGAAVSITAGDSAGAEGGGGVFISGGAGADSGGYGGSVTISGGTAADGGAEAAIELLGASGDSPGSDGGINIHASALFLNDHIFGPAAHLAHGSTADQIIDALIAAGLMAAS